LLSPPDLSLCGDGYADEGCRKSHCLTSPSSEHVRNKYGEDSVTILLTRSPWLRYTRQLVSPSLRYLTPSKTLFRPLLLPAAAIVEAVEAALACPECSRSKILTSPSPAAVITVLSWLCGMNLTEKMFCVCPVATVQASWNCFPSRSDWYVWMFKCWSSEPDARRPPDLDQLKAFTQPECPSSSLTISRLAMSEGSL